MPTLPHLMTVERLGTTTNNRETYSARPDVACFLQPLESDENATGDTPAFSKASRCFVPYDANVKLKDRVTIHGVTYYVTGERTHQYGSWPHRVLSLEAIQ